MATTRSRPFLAGFLIVLAAFVAVSALDAHLRSDCGLLVFFKLRRCYDDIRRAGFPLQFYEEGGLAYRKEFNPLFLGCDIAIGLTLSLLGGLVTRRRFPTG